MAMTLSYIGQAAIDELEANHAAFRNTLWAQTSGKIVGEIQYTPRECWDSDHDPQDGHSDWLVDGMANLLQKTEFFCDFMSLSPPNGYFLKKIKEDLATVATRSKHNRSAGNNNNNKQNHHHKIVVRFMFGNVVTVPVDCEAVLRELTSGIPTDSNLEIWVGAWRKSMCWNHAKIVAVDGKYLHTGGHNLWDDMCLQKDPIHDTSIQLEGKVATERAQFCQWTVVLYSEGGELAITEVDGEQIPRCLVLANHNPCHNQQLTTIDGSYLCSNL
jgi:hypothetical protein